MVKRKEPVLSVDFRYYFDEQTDGVEHSARTCVSNQAIMDGLLKVLGASQYVVLTAIASCMDKEGKAFPSQRKLAEMTGLHHNTVNKLIKDLLDVEFNGSKLLKRELVGTGHNFKKKSVYHISNGIVTATEDVIGDSKPKDELVNPESARDFAHYFAYVYEETFGQGYTINYGRDLKLIKDKLLKTYDKETLKAIITIAVEQYADKWANTNYPLPTLAMLSTWLSNEAYGIYKQTVDAKETAARRKTESTASDESDLALDLL